MKTVHWLRMSGSNSSSASISDSIVPNALGSLSAWTMEGVLCMGSV